MEEKRYFTISEVSRASGVPEHSIRYWEKQFQLLRPIRKESGHRRYTERELEVLAEIKDLVYHQKMTLAGAKKALSRRHSRTAQENTQDAVSDGETLKLLAEIRKDLSAILKE